MRRHTGLLRAATLGLLLIASAITASAQLDKLKNTTPQERAKAQTIFMKSKLDLTEAQLPKVEALNLKYAEKLDPVIKGSAGPLVKMGEFRQANEDKEAELKGILSPDQFQRYLAAKQEMREKVVSEMRERAKSAP
jgi:hypothetical protein